MVASIISCVAFVLMGRRWYRLPIDSAGLGAIPLLAGLFVLLAYATAHLIGDTRIVLALDALLFCLFGGSVAVRFGLPIAVSERAGEWMRFHSRRIRSRKWRHVS
jgi:hypothetical protein